jgi:uncharacterized membrane protein YccF (DUF307 family)
MVALFNVLWFIFVGWWSFLVFIILSGIFAITIVGIPIAKALFQFAKLNAFPYGKEIIRETELKGKTNVSKVRKIGGIIVNIIWIPIGIILALYFLVAGVLAAITVVGIPVGVVYIRMSKFIITPIGAKVVTNKQAIASAVANEIEKRDKKR